MSISKLFRLTGIFCGAKPRVGYALRAKVCSQIARICNFANASNAGNDEKNRLIWGGSSLILAREPGMGPSMVRNFSASFRQQPLP